MDYNSKFLLAKCEALLLWIVVGSEPSTLRTGIMVLAVLIAVINVFDSMINTSNRGKAG